jgi:hypothetical protein
VDIGIGSTEVGGGALVADYDFAMEVPVFFNTCLGGSGALCDGGILLYSGEDPGFAPIEEEEPEESVFPLEEGTEVSLEVTSKDAAAGLFIGGQSLGAVGDSAVLGTAIEGLHTHGEWQLTFPGGDEPMGDYFLGLKLTESSGTYADSEEFVVVLTPSDGG